jgi:hypothetical protein
MVEEATEIKGNMVDMTTTAVEMDSEEVVVVASAAEVTIVIETLEVMARILDGKTITAAAAAIKVADTKEVAVVDTTVGEEDNHMGEEDHPFTAAEVMEEEAVEVIMTEAEEEVMDRKRTPWASMVMIVRTRSWRWNSSILMKSRLQASILIRYVYLFHPVVTYYSHFQVHSHS